MDNLRGNIERQPTGPVEKEKIEKKQDSKELQETSREFVEGVSEVVGDIESGEIAEKTGEDKKSGPQGQFPQKKDGKVQVEIKPLVLPTIEVMQIKIATAIKKEIVVLEQEAKKVEDNPYKFSETIGKIRNLRGILSELTHVTFETLKNWWMEFVNKA